jgi:hypothetical protein
MEKNENKEDDSQQNIKDVKGVKGIVEKEKIGKISIIAQRQAFTPYILIFKREINTLKKCTTEGCVKEGRYSYKFPNDILGSKCVVHRRIDMNCISIPICFYNNASCKGPGYYMRLSVEKIIQSTENENRDSLFIPYYLTKRYCSAHRSMVEEPTVKVGETICVEKNCKNLAYYSSSGEKYVRKCQRLVCKDHVAAFNVKEKEVIQILFSLFK